MSKSTLSSLALALVFLLVLFGIWSCESPPTTIASNTLPITRLANVPPPDTFIVTDNPRLSLSWIGDDPDGYVIAFRYRWSYRLTDNSPFLYKPWTTILNSWNALGGGTEGKDNFALMTDAEVSNLPNVYHYFAILLNGLTDADAAVLAAGESLQVAGAHVWASNPRANRFPVHTKPTSGTFIFDSQDSLNPHTFEVCAVDNDAAVGNPASVNFGTPRVIPPHAEVVGFPLDTVMVLMDATETFPGIEFQFRGFDPNSRTIDYSWVVDRDLWPADSIPWSPFSQNTSVFVTARNFPDPYATQHTFYVRARNEFGSIDTVGYFLRQRYDNNNTALYDSAGTTLTHNCPVCTALKDTVVAQKNFLTIYPPFQRDGYQQRILLINISYSSVDASPAHPTRDMVTDYYLSMLNTIGKSAVVDTTSITQAIDGSLTFPGLGTFSKYSTVIFVGDAIASSGQFINFSWFPRPASMGQLSKTLMAYVGIGGKMVLSAWNLPYSLNFGLGDVQRSICHIQNVSDVEKDRDTVHATFIGARGLKGYPAYIAVDQAKLDPSWHGSLFYLHPGRPYGFGEIIYQYDRAEDTSFIGRQFENKTIGVRYLGVTYDAVYFGFPLYYMEQASATEALRQALSDIKELNR